MTLARRNLLVEKTRMALSISGVALAVTLILVLNGFLTGMYRQITSYLDHSPGSIVVAQKDVVNMLGANSLLPSRIIKQVEAIQGVENAIPILSQFVILDLHGRKQPAYLVGYDPKEGGGPWEITEGRQPSNKGEMVFDGILARRHSLNIGDQIIVLGRNFTIVGLSNGTNSWMTSFFFIPKSDAEELLLAPGATSFLLLTTSRGADPNGILRQANTLSGVNALTKSEMAANDLKLFAKVFSAPLKLMVGIAFLVGTMVIGLMIYTITVERQREYGVIKAIGASNPILYRVVLTQAVVAALSGTITGVFLSYGISQMIMSSFPQFFIVLDPSDVGWAILAGLGMALIAALFPARVIASLAPAEVFQK